MNTVRIQVYFLVPSDEGISRYILFFKGKKWRNNTFSKLENGMQIMHEKHTFNCTNS